MSGILDVVALHEHDARRAEEGGADRLTVLGSLDDGGMSPEPSVVETVRRAVGIEVRPMVRLRPGYGTDGGEFVRLRGLIESYVDAGADGVVFGFLNGYDEVDAEVCGALTEHGLWRWTFHQAVDQTLDTDKAWRVLQRLPRLDSVLTAGSARGMDHGLDELVARCRADAGVAGLVMAGGGLAAEHVPWLARAGVRAFHISEQARPLGQFKAYVDAPLVRTWRELVDREVGA
ncbi:copper homeostasis protein CutC [Luteococcus peritonei]|uniref:Copper homeostasis protein cutC homolog n=1 Tax=Luteococcus peritonei TaxID=88874 RepID=A0ABW4RR00_9ACTN